MQEKVIFVFPGQGAQHVGMCADVFREYAAARHIFEEVSDYANRDIARICIDGPADVLNSAVNTSLCTFTHSVALANLIDTKFGLPVYRIAYAITGHSAGQYAALHCADSMPMRDAVNLLTARAKYMSHVTGGMACMVGLPIDKVRKIVSDANKFGFVAISNHNAHDQFILSGQNDALNHAVGLGTQSGAKLARRLNVSVPAHCALMQNAATKFRDDLNKADIRSPKTNWFSNQTADIMTNPTDVKDALANQMTHGVRWLEIMEKFPEHNITRAYELGPGQTLSRLINRTIGDRCIAAPCNNLNNVHAMLNALEKNLSR